MNTGDYDRYLRSGWPEPFEEWLNLTWEEQQDIRRQRLADTNWEMK